MAIRMASLLAGAALLASGPAHAADCRAVGDAGAAERTLSLGNKDDADLIVAMTLAPTLFKLSYESVAAEKLDCPLATFRSGGDDYTLYGGTGGGPVARAGGERRPAALLVPVVNIVKAMAASKSGKPAGIEGYMLAVLVPGRLTGYRFYTGVPDAATLAAAMADALGGRTRPLFSQDQATGKTTLYAGS